jgi:PAS domain S-box-containing protein
MMTNRSVKNELFERILDKSSDAIQVSNLQGQLVYVNKIAGHRLGINQSEVEKYNVRDFEKIFASEGAWEKHLSDVRQSDGLIIEGINVNQETGEKFPVEVSVKIARVEGEEFVIASSRDITDRKKAETKLNSALQLTRDQNEQLQSFAQIVSHNLRTHASNIGSLLELLKDEHQQLAESEIFQYLIKGSDQLNETIYHLSDVAKMRYIDEADLKKINLRDCCENCINNLTAKTRQNRINISNEIDRRHAALGIPAYVESILLNLLTNAVKYRREGEACEVTVTSRQDGDFVMINVSDNGLGIDLEKYGKDLFKIYKTFHRRQDSQGVGLFITKNQVAAMGGKIEVKSKVNVGSTFTVYLKCP